MDAPADSHRLSPDRLIWILRRADQSVQAMKATRLRPHGLTSAQYSALVRIENAPGVSPAELARRLFVSPQAVTGLIGRLETAGYVRRGSHAHHTGVFELHLTESGRILLETVEETMADLDEHVSEIVGREDAEVLRTLLRRLVVMADGA